MLSLLSITSSSITSAVLLSFLVVLEGAVFSSSDGEFTLSGSQSSGSAINLVNGTRFCIWVVRIEGVDADNKEMGCDRCGIILVNA